MPSSISESSFPQPLSSLFCCFGPAISSFSLSSSVQLILSVSHHVIPGVILHLSVHHLFACVINCLTRTVIGDVCTKPWMACPWHNGVIGDTDSNRRCTHKALNGLSMTLTDVPYIHTYIHGSHTILTVYVGLAQALPNHEGMKWYTYTHACTHAHFQHYCIYSICSVN